MVMVVTDQMISELISCIFCFFLKGITLYKETACTYFKVNKI